MSFKCQALFSHPFPAVALKNNINRLGFFNAGVVSSAYT